MNIIKQENETPNNEKMASPDETSVVANIETSFWAEFATTRANSFFERILIAVVCFIVAFLLGIRENLFAWLIFAIITQIIDFSFAKKLKQNSETTQNRTNYKYAATLSSFFLALIIPIFWFSHISVAQILIAIFAAGAIYMINLTAGKIKYLSSYLTFPYIIFTFACYFYELIKAEQFPRIHTFALIFVSLIIIFGIRLTSENRVKNTASLKAALIDAEEKRNQAETSNAAKSHYLATISHELRTPLNAILGSATLIGQQNKDPKTKELLGTMIGASQGMISLLNDLLDLSKIEAGKMEFEDLVFSPAVQVKKSTDLFTGPLQSKNLELILDFQESFPKAMHGDPSRIGQIINNLLSNGIKFTEKGSITVTGTSDDEYVYIAVKDSGIGLTPEGIAKLFKPFSQADKSTSRHHGGTGLGLSTAHNLATLMGGDLIVTSEYGHGAIFTLSLPKVLADESELPKDEMSLEEIIPMAEGEGIKVLAADDNASNRFILNSFLEMIGAETTLVNDGREAVEAAEQKDFDIILLDVRMPVLDGLSACREIRKLGGNNANVPIIMVSADAGPTHVRLGENAGANGYLTKPLSAPKLFAILEETLGGEEGSEEEELGENVAEA